MKRKKERKKERKDNYKNKKKKKKLVHAQYTIAVGNLNS